MRYLLNFTATGRVLVRHRWPHFSTFGVFCGCGGRPAGRILDSTKKSR